MRFSVQSLPRLCWDERGQGLVEYALMIALIVPIAVGAASLLGVNANAIFEPVFDVVE